MATRKQRARRAKTFRHEYGFVMNDEEGNEVEVPGAEVRGKKPDDARSPAAKKSLGRRSTTRSRLAPKPPSWDRALKRGGLWGIGIGFAVTFLFHGPIVLGLVYGRDVHPADLLDGRVRLPPLGAQAPSSDQAVTPRQEPLSGVVLRL